MFIKMVLTLSRKGHLKLLRHSQLIIQLLMMPMEVMVLLRVSLLYLEVQLTCEVMGLHLQLKQSMELRLGIVMVLLYLLLLTPLLRTMLSINGLSIPSIMPLEPHMNQQQMLRQKHLGQLIIL